jgi:hypothetical protein
MITRRRQRHHLASSTLDARWNATQHCARLGGEVIAPAAAARQLDPASNICLFVPINDGDPTPKLSASDFDPTKCP